MEKEVEKVIGIFANKANGIFLGRGMEFNKELIEVYYLTRDFVANPVIQSIAKKIDVEINGGLRKIREEYHLIYFRLIDERDKIRASISNISTRLEFCDSFQIVMSDFVSTSDDEIAKHIADQLTPFYSNTHIGEGIKADVKALEPLIHRMIELKTLEKSP